MARTLDYNRIAGDYARHRKIHPGVFAGLMAGGELGAASRALEVGCGTGNYASAIRAATGATVFGIDPSREMLAKAGTQDRDLILAEGSAERLAFEDGTFDLVYSCDVIHHVKDRPAFFAEALRVLRPGGRLCTVTDSHHDIARRIPLSSHFPETVAIELARYPSIGTLASEMMAAGFGGIFEEHAEQPYPLNDISGYRDRAYSSLHLIDEAAFAAGIARLEDDLASGPIAAVSLYTLLWGAPRG
ncbi:MAG: class I SAM-dependent methyltransferase [Chloroflexota bacterium]